MIWSENALVDTLKSSYSCDLLSTYYVTSTVLNVLTLLSHVILAMTL
jgi:hypothetical protein